MINVSLATGHVLAGESAALFEAADNALLNSARLAVSLLEASSEARLDPRTKQKLLESMSAGQSDLVSSRRSFTSLHSQLVVLQRKTNLAEVNWGCGELGDILRAMAPEVPDATITNDGASRSVPEIRSWE